MLIVRRLKIKSFFKTLVDKQLSINIFMLDCLYLKVLKNLTYSDSVANP